MIRLKHIMVAMLVVGSAMHWGIAAAQTKHAPKTKPAAKKKEAEICKEIPAPSCDLVAGNSLYSITIETGKGMPEPLPMNRTIKDENGNWAVTDLVTSPDGNQSDKVVYKKGTLKLISRVARSGDDSVTYTYEGNKVTITAGGQTSTLTMPGAYIHDGSSNDLLIARLPLKPGYEVRFYVATQDGKANLDKLKVAGKEKINDVECYKCVLENTADTKDVTTYFVGIKDKVVRKIIATIPTVPGALMTMELQTLKPVNTGAKDGKKTK